MKDMKRTRKQPKQGSDPTFLAKTPAFPPIGKGRVPMVRQAGHFIDQKLKTADARAEAILNDLLPESKGKVIDYRIARVGVPNLKPSEDKLVNALYRLLRDKSESRDVSAKNFYQGNYPSDRTVECGEIKLPWVAIRVRMIELYKAYTGKNRISGKESQLIKSTLDEFRKREFLIWYERVREIGEGKSVEKRFDLFQLADPLVRIGKVIKDLTAPERERVVQGGSIDEKTDLVFYLHPLFIHQIREKYVEMPENINSRMNVAAGGAHRLKPCINLLRDYLCREISAGRHVGSGRKTEINEETLLLQLDLQDERRERQQQGLLDAVGANKNLGLILNHEIVIGAQGQRKHVFHLPERFV